jgi:5-hydroxyisourate hydrolase-like protein (transthyretin family)
MKLTLLLLIGACVCFGNGIYGSNTTHVKIETATVFGNSPETTVKKFLNWYAQNKKRISQPLVKQERGKGKYRIDFIASERYVNELVKSEFFQKVLSATCVRI